MNAILTKIGSLAGYLGALLCLSTGLLRITGSHYVIGYQSTTLFTAGMAMMVFAVFLKLEANNRS